jgi:hypothetical protein
LASCEDEKQPCRYQDPPLLPPLALFLANHSLSFSRDDDRDGQRARSMIHRSTSPPAQGEPVMLNYLIFWRSMLTPRHRTTPATPSAPCAAVACWLRGWLSGRR